MTQLEGCPAWIIGDVVALASESSQNEAVILPTASIIEVEYPLPILST